MCGKAFIWAVTVFCLAARLAMAAYPVAPGAVLTEVYGGSGFYEGPSWDPATAKLYFTDLNNPSRILRLDAPFNAANWMTNSQGINGTFLGLGGRLLAARGDTKQILSMRIGATGAEDIQILAGNNTWNATNDLCQTYAGDIYFTTPDFANGTTGAVYRISPFGVVTKIVSDMGVPNGIIASNDGTQLYVSDSWAKWWRRYPINADGSVGAGSLFFNPSTSNQSDPDGMSVDEDGNIYCTGRGGVWVVAPNGSQVNMIPVPATIENCTFGGVDGKTLYMACNTKVYSLAMSVRGGFWTHYPDTNAPPNVSAGPDKTVYAGQSVHLDGVITDDGGPKPITSVWTVVSNTNIYNIQTPSSPTSGLVVQPGTYTFRLTAYDGSRTVADDVTISAYRLADLDHDGLINTNDANALAKCIGGANVPVATDCQIGDLDQDTDVDQSDFAILQRCLGVPNPPAGTDCTP